MAARLLVFAASVAAAGVLLATSGGRCRRPPPPPPPVSPPAGGGGGGGGGGTKTRSRRARGAPADAVAVTRMTVARFRADTEATAAAMAAAGMDGAFVAAFADTLRRGYRAHVVAWEGDGAFAVPAAAFSEWLADVYGRAVDGTLKGRRAGHPRGRRAREGGGAGPSCGG